MMVCPLEVTYFNTDCYNCKYQILDANYYTFFKMMQFERPPFLTLIAIDHLFQGGGGWGSQWKSW